MPTSLKVLVADDHPGMLAAIVSVLDDDARFEVVATAGTAQETLEQAGRVHVDVALVDVNMPGGGVAAARALTALPHPPVVVAVSAQAAGGVVEDMLRAGAVGYLTKGRVGGTLPDLVARCAEGEVVLAAPSAAQALRAALGHGARLSDVPA